MENLKAQIRSLVLKVGDVHVSDIVDQLCALFARETASLRDRAEKAENACYGCKDSEADLLRKLIENRDAEIKTLQAERDEARQQRDTALDRQVDLEQKLRQAKSELEAALADNAAMLQFIQKLAPKCFALGREIFRVVLGEWLTKARDAMEEKP